MRYGFTTGSCAAAAAKAAAYMLLTGRPKKEVTIRTPKGILYHAEILDIHRKEQEVSCAVEKNGGDDPDITTGAKIYAKASCLKNKGQEIIIDGGTGIGRVTRKGLDQPVGNAAINHVPREMIKKEVLEVCRLADYQGSLKIEISVPDGERLAAWTFNPRLGIVGGISILGTSGIVEPMSSQAVLDTIFLELRQRRESGFDYVAVSPGNYGLDFMKQTYGGQDAFGNSCVGRDSAYSLCGNGIWGNRPETASACTYPPGKNESGRNRGFREGRTVHACD